MIRSELIARIAGQNPHLHERDVEALVRVILDRISEALVDGDRVELRDFGTFCVRERGARIGRNPRTGKEAFVPVRAHVQFKPGKSMRSRLNIQAADPDREVARLLTAS